MLVRILKVEIRYRILSFSESSMEICCNTYYNFFMKDFIRQQPLVLITKISMVFLEIYLVLQIEC